MAKILKEGRAHKGYVWTDFCDICESRLKLYEDKNDPCVVNCLNQGAYFKELDYICPVCKASNATFAAFSGRTENINNDRCQARAKRGHTTREYVVFTREDLEEIRSYQKAEEEEPDNEPFFIE